MKLSQSKERLISVFLLLFLLLSTIGGLSLVRTSKLFKTGAQTAYPITPGQQIAHTSTLAGNREYLLFLPQNYNNPPAGGWPLLMFFHGAGIGETSGVNGIKIEALPGMLGSRPDFPFIVVSPRMYGPDFPASGNVGWMTPTALNSMYTLLNEIQTNYQVNKNKTYATGYSLGGGVTWNMGITYPEKFAALAPVAGFFQTHMSLTVPSNICDLYTKPIRAYHGTGDTSIVISIGRGLVNAINNCGGTDYASLIEGAWSHDGISHPVYTANDSLYDWFLTKSLSGTSEPSSQGDVNSDGEVNIIDIGIIIDAYGKLPVTNPKADLDNSGTVNIIDIGIVIDNYS